MVASYFWSRRIVRHSALFGLAERTDLPASLIPTTIIEFGSMQLMCLQSSLFCRQGCRPQVSEVYEATLRPQDFTA